MADWGLWSAVVGAGAASIAAIFAGSQIWYSRRDANNRATFEHLRVIDERLQSAWPWDIVKAQEELIASYSGNKKDLTEGGRAYLALLNSLELLAYARKKNLVNRKSTDDFIRTIINPRIVPLIFLEELQKCCEDNNVFAYLYAYSAKIQRQEPAVSFYLERVKAWHSRGSPSQERLGNGKQRGKSRERP